jgi:predicted trehalose synthase
LNNRPDWVVIPLRGIKALVHNSNKAVQLSIT